ncbi:MAG TPA: hypothetical protein VKA46_40315 [Gemmataceae bacterium]|nr:hypothetical protein [Gemmataceae bacterium]
MRWSAILSRLFGRSAASARPARSSRPRRRGRFHPGVEVLEGRLTPSGSSFSVFAGGGTTWPAQAATPTAAQLSFPNGVAVDSGGNVYIADTHNSGMVEKVDSQGHFSVFAGGGSTAPAQATTPTDAQIIWPTGVAVDSSGNVYIVDNGNNLVEKVTPQGQFSVIAGGGEFQLSSPTGVAVDGGGNVYIANTAYNVVDKVDSQGYFSVFAGGGSTAPAQATTPTAAQLSMPNGVAVDGSGNVYIADSFHNLVEKVDSQGHFSVIAGGGSTAPAQATTPTAAQLSMPNGVAIDGSGTVYIADTSNNLVEKVGTATQATPTFSGLAGPTISYGTATVTLSGTLAAGEIPVANDTVSITVNGVTQTTSTNSSGAFTLAFPTATLAVSGSPYTITYAYAGSENFTSASDTSHTLTITKATPTFSGLAGPTISYGTATTTLSGTLAAGSTPVASDTVSITVNGVSRTASTDSSGAFSFNFPTATLGVSGSPYTITYAYAASANFTSASDTSHTLTITKATPTFSGLAGPTISYGTATATLSGTLAAGSTPVANDTVSITVNGVSRTANTDSSGAFSLAFPSATLAVSGSPYTITYAYAGSANFSSASDAGHSLTITKATPAVSVVDAGGTYTGSAFAATATVKEGTTLEGVGLTLQYYSGSYSSPGQLESHTPLAGAPSAAGTYTVLASFAGSADYSSGAAVATFTISPAAPVVSVSDAGGVYTGRAFAATGKVRGGATLEGVGLVLHYYSGSYSSPSLLVDRTPLAGAPSATGTYTVLAWIPTATH